MTFKECLVTISMEVIPVWILPQPCIARSTRCEGCVYEAEWQSSGCEAPESQAKAKIKGHSCRLKYASMRLSDRMMQTYCFDTILVWSINGGEFCF
jgi:hypothetical protein